MFVSYKSMSDCFVEMGTAAKAEIVGIGDILLKTRVHGKDTYFKLEKVCHIPSFKYSLLSVRVFDQKGLSTSFQGKRCTVSSDSKDVFQAQLQGSLYILNAEWIPSKMWEIAHIAATLDTWHKRLAHVNSDGILRMVRKGVVRGIKLSNNSMKSVCGDCVTGKAHRCNIPKLRSSPRSANMLDLVHSDVCGPMEVPSIGGSRYFVTFIDDHSSWVTVFPIARKADVTKCFVMFQRCSERRTGRKIVKLRSDRGGEYLCTVLKDHFLQHGIFHELTSAYTPHQNGIAERQNRTLLELVRTMLHSKDLPKMFWAEALATAVYIRNRVTCKSLGPELTPHHIWEGYAPILKHIRIFGSLCWYAIPKKSLQKLDARGREAIFVGYAEQSKAYKLLDKETHDVIISRDVIFDEFATSLFPPMPRETMKFFLDNENGDDDEIVSLDLDSPDNGRSQNLEDPHGKGNEATENRMENENMGSSEPEIENDDENEMINADNTGNENETIEETVEDSTSGIVPRRSSRIRRAPGNWWRSNTCIENFNHALIATATKEIPGSYKEAINGPDAEFWKTGIESEISSKKKFKTWSLVLRSKAAGRKVLTTKWIFLEKKVVDGKGKSTSYPKARNVVRGFEQVQGVDYEETFAPVVKYTSIRTVCAYVAEEDLELHQMDAKTAFLNGEIDEEIFIEIPEGVEIETSELAESGLDSNLNNGELDLVCKLNKSMYGTKQAPRCWNKKIDSVLSGELGYKRSEGDPCLYVKRTRTDVMMVALYVDDLLLAATTTDQIEWMKKRLAERFEMKDLGEARVCLGLEITRVRKDKKLYLTQESYMEMILGRFGMCESKPAPTPIEEARSPETRLEIVSDDDEKATGVPYREVIGSLMYLMIATRPDICYAVGKLSKFCEDPQQKHWIAAKRVLRYVNGTKSMGLCYNGSKHTTVYGYSDSDWAGDINDRKSTSGYAFLMAGSAVSWSSKKQSIIATSTCEAEYVALSMACKEAIWLRRLLTEVPMKIDLSKGLKLFTDSQSAMKLSANESINRRNKHIDINFHYVREVTRNKDVVLEYIATEYMVADMMTKPLGRAKFQRLRELCGIGTKEVYRSM